MKKVVSARRLFADIQRRAERDRLRVEKMFPRAKELCPTEHGWVIEVFRNLATAEAECEISGATDDEIKEQLDRFARTNEIEERKP